MFEFLVFAVGIPMLSAFVFSRVACSAKAGLQAGRIIFWGTFLSSIFIGFLYGTYLDWRDASSGQVNTIPGKGVMVAIELIMAPVVALFFARYGKSRFQERK